MAASGCIREAELGNLNAFALIFSVSHSHARECPSADPSVGSKKFPVMAAGAAENSLRPRRHLAGKPEVSAPVALPGPQKFGKFPVSREFWTVNRECRTRRFRPHALASRGVEFTPRPGQASSN